MGFIPSTEWLFTHFFEEVVRCCNTISVYQLCLGWSLYADKTVHGVLTKVRLQRIFSLPKVIRNWSVLHWFICWSPHLRAGKTTGNKSCQISTVKRDMFRWLAAVRQLKKLALDLSDGGNPGWFLWFAFLASGMRSVETNYQSNKSYILFPTSVWDQI